jgi:CBS domain-containing protein
MRVDDVMKSPQCCGEGDSVRDVAKTMKEDNIGFVPVCNDDGEPIGALTDRDLTVRVLAEGRSSSTRAADVMTSDVVSCRIGDDLDTAERTMREHRKARMMVCDESGRLVGVISLSDIADVESEDAAGRTLREVTSRESQQPHAS